MGPNGPDWQVSAWHSDTISVTACSSRHQNSDAAIPETPSDAMCADSDKLNAQEGGLDRGGYRDKAL